MKVIPLHLRRRFERRWAASFASPGTSTARRTPELKAAIIKDAKPRAGGEGAQTGGTGCFTPLSEHSE